MCVFFSLVVSSKMINDRYHFIRAESLRAKISFPCESWRITREINFFFLPFRRKDRTSLLSSWTICNADNYAPRASKNCSLTYFAVSLLSAASKIARKSNNVSKSQIKVSQDRRHVAPLAAVISFDCAEKSQKTSPLLEYTREVRSVEAHSDTGFSLLSIYSYIYLSLSLSLCKCDSSRRFAQQLIKPIALPNVISVLRIRSRDCPIGWNRIHLRESCPLNRAYRH